MPSADDRRTSRRLGRRRYCSGAARDLGHLDLVVLIDSALALGDIDPDACASCWLRRRPGSARCCARRTRVAIRAPSRAVRRCCGCSTTRWTSRSSRRSTSSTAEGRLLGRADLLVIGTGNVHEYDGSGHRKRDQQRSDLRRERRLAGTPYVRRGFTLDDLLNHPGVVMHELDRALGRSASGPSPEAVAPADGPLDVLRGRARPAAQPLAPGDGSRRLGMNHSSRGPQTCGLGPNRGNPSAAPARGSQIRGRGLG